MHLIYLDETGNSGKNLAEPSQPIFVLCALVVPETHWQDLESALGVALDKHFPTRPEVHTYDIVSPGRHSFFRTSSEADRLAFLKEWISIAASFDLKVIHRAIVKTRYARWLEKEYGPGVFINPHSVAFLFVSQVVNEYLRAAPGNPRGIFISDESQEMMEELEQSIRLLRMERSALQLSQIVEKGFFIDSRKSLPLQLCDLCAYALRQMEADKVGLRVKPIHKTLIASVRPLIHRGVEQMPDVLTWLDAQQKEGRPGK